MELFEKSHIFYNIKKYKRKVWTLLPGTHQQKKSVVSQILTFLTRFFCQIKVRDYLTVFHIFSDKYYLTFI